MEVNSKFAGSEKAVRRWNEMLRTDFETGWSSTSDIKGVFDHELGHLLHDYKLRDFSSPFADALRYCKEKPPVMLKGVFQVSEYAATDEFEAFAEAYSFIRSAPRSQWNSWVQGFAKEMQKGFKILGEDL